MKTTEAIIAVLVVVSIIFLGLFFVNKHDSDFTMDAIDTWLPTDIMLNPPTSSQSLTVDPVFINNNFGEFYVGIFAKQGDLPEIILSILSCTNEEGGAVEIPSIEYFGEHNLMIGERGVMPVRVESDLPKGIYICQLSLSSCDGCEYLSTTSFRVNVGRVSEEFDKEQTNGGELQTQEVDYCTNNPTTLKNGAEIADCKWMEQCYADFEYWESLVLIDKYGKRYDTTQKIPWMTEDVEYCSYQELLTNIGTSKIYKCYGNGFYRVFTILDNCRLIH